MVKNFFPSTECYELVVNACYLVPRSNLNLNSLMLAERIAQRIFLEWEMDESSRRDMSVIDLIAARKNYCGEALHDFLKRETQYLLSRQQLAGKRALPQADNHEDYLVTQRKVYKGFVKCGIIRLTDNRWSIHDWPRGINLRCDLSKWIGE